MTGSVRRLGADPDDLRQLAATFDRAGRTLADAAVRVDRALGRTGWHGPAAAQFARRWHTDLAALRTVAARTSAAAAALHRQARDQEATSRDVHESAAPPALTRSESLLRLGGFVDVGAVEGRTSLVARVEELDGARSRVTVSDALGLAGVAAAGATVELGCGTASANPVRPLRAEAETSVGLEVEHRTVWEVPDDKVHTLLAAEGVERAAASVGLGPLAAAVAHHLEPRPSGQEVLVRATVSAGAVSPRLGAVGPGATGQAAASVAVGLATTQGGGHLVVETTDEAAAVFRPGFLSAFRVRPQQLGTAVWARLELPPDDPTTPGRPVRLELRRTSPDGKVERVVVHARLSEDAAVRAAAERARRDLGAGRPPSRTTLDALLAGVRGAVVDPVVQSDHLQSATTACSARAVGGAGVRIGGGTSAQVVNLRPSRR